MEQHTPFQHIPAMNHLIKNSNRNRGIKFVRNFTTVESFKNAKVFNLPAKKTKGTEPALLKRTSGLEQISGSDFDQKKLN